MPTSSNASDSCSITRPSETCTNGWMQATITTCIFLVKWLCSQGLRLACDLLRYSYLCWLFKSNWELTTVRKPRALLGCEYFKFCEFFIKDLPASEQHLLRVGLQKHRKKVTRVLPCGRKAIVKPIGVKRSTLLGRCTAHPQRGRFLLKHITNLRTRFGLQCALWGSCRHSSSLQKLPQNSKHRGGFKDFQS